MDNSIVLSGELEEKAVQTLIHVGLEDLFPELCDKWRIAKQDIHARYRQEFTTRRDTVCQDIAKGEDSLRSALREVVVEDVMKLFPYVYPLFRRRHDDSVCIYYRSLQRDDISVIVEAGGSPSAGQEATGRVVSVSRFQRASWPLQSRCGSLILNHFTLASGLSTRSILTMPDSTPR